VKKKYQQMGFELFLAAGATICKQKKKEMRQNTEYIPPRNWKPWYRGAPWSNRTKKEVEVEVPSYSGNRMTIKWPRAPNRNVQFKL